MDMDKLAYTHCGASDTNGLAVLDDRLPFGKVDQCDLVPERHTLSRGDSYWLPSVQEGHLGLAYSYVANGHRYGVTLSMTKEPDLVHMPPSWSDLSPLSLPARPAGVNWRH